MELTVGEMDAEGHTKIDLTIADLFKLYDKENILANQKFIVKYTVRINRDAVIEESMDNAVSLEFSNDPNWEDDGDPTTPPPPPTGETPEDEAHAFTFGLKVSKTVVSALASDLEREFTFTVELNDDTISGKYGDVEFTNGKATFTLPPQSLVYYCEE